MIIRELFTRWGFKADDRAVKRFDRAIGVAKKGALLATKAVAGIASAAVAAGAGIAALTTKVASDIEEVDRWGRRLGIPTRELSQLNHAAKMAGADLEDLTDVIKEGGVKAYDAAGGSKDLQKVFRELGVEIKNSDGTMRSQLDLFYDIADGLSKMKDQTRKAAITDQLFSDAGIRLLPVLERGRIGIAAMRREANELGVTLDSKALAASRDFNAGLRQLRGSISGLVLGIGRQFLPVLGKYIKLAGGWLRANRAIINQKLAQWIGKVTDYLAKLDTGSVIAGLADLWDKLGIVLDAVVLLSRALLGAIDALVWLGDKLGWVAAQYYLMYSAIFGTLGKLGGAVVGFVTTVIAWFARLPAVIAGAFAAAGPAASAFFGSIYDWIASIPARLLASIKQGLEEATAWARAHLGKAGELILGAGPAPALAPSRVANTSTTNRTVNLSAPLQVQVAAGTSTVEARRLGAAAAQGASDSWRATLPDLER